MTERGPLDAAAEHAARFVEGLRGRPVGVEASVEDLRAALGGSMPDGPADPVAVIDELVAACDPGLVASAGPRYFGFVIGGGHPVAVAADWLASVWDQNAGLYAAGPAASVVEEVVADWLIDVFGLPVHASAALVTGAQMAHFTALAAARHHLLAGRGWNVEEQGLFGAPRIRVLTGDQRHVTIDRALKYLGMGSASVEPLPSDGQGRLILDGLGPALAQSDDPTIVCVQAGDVNSGAFDDVAGACAVAHEHGAWVHVDGAFGLWAAASEKLRHLVAGLAGADSWTTDGHKMLNVPYDSGYVFCAHPEAHNAAVGVHASYLMHAAGRQRDQVDWTPEFSRRARGFAAYATLRALGRSGVAELVERCCGHARRFAETLSAEPGVDVLNEVVFNQVLVRFRDADGADVAPRVVGEVQRDGTCWLSGSTWKGQPVMRISVSNWSTTTEDVDRSVEAILRIYRNVR